MKAFRWGVQYSFRLRQWTAKTESKLVPHDQLSRRQQITKNCLAFFHNQLFYIIFIIYHRHLRFSTMGSHELGRFFCFPHRLPRCAIALKHDAAMMQPDLSSCQCQLKWAQCAGSRPSPDSWAIVDSWLWPWRGSHCSPFGATGDPTGVCNAMSSLVAGLKRMAASAIFGKLQSSANSSQTLK